MDVGIRASCKNQKYKTLHRHRRAAFIAAGVFDSSASKINMLLNTIHADMLVTTPKHDVR